MHRVVKILILLMLVSGYAEAQSFPSTDSLRRYIDRYIRNSAIDAFTNLRLNTALKGTLGRLDSVAATVAGGVRTVDSIWKANDSTFAYRIRSSTYYLTDRGTGGGSGGGGTIDLTPTDGSGNAVSSNGVFDALAGKAGTTHTHSGADITTGFIPTGRFQSGTVPLAALSATGTLNSTTFLRGDGTFATPPGATYSATAPLVLTGSAFSIPLATNSVSGYLSSTDRTAFAAKLGAADTISLSNRIRRAVFRFVSLNDTTMASLDEAGAIIDSMQFQGSFGGGSSGGGSGGVSTFSAGNLSPLFTTVVTNSNTTPALAFTLSNAAAYSILGRAAGTGLPSYLTALDSNWIPGLHTEAYYNTKYALIGSGGGGSSAWTSITGTPTTLAGYGITDAASSTHTHTFASLTSKPTTLVGYGITDAQPLDADLTTIAGLTATTGNTLMAVSGAWSSQTPTQVKTALSLNNLDNTSDANKPVSTAQAASIATKQATLVSGTNIKTINGSSVLGSGDLTVSGSSPTAIGAQIGDSIIANRTVIRNYQNAGADTVFVLNATRDTLSAKTINMIAGVGTTVSKVVTATGITYQTNMTGTASLGEKIARFNTSYTVTLSLGYIQNLGFYGNTTSRVVTLPAANTVDGLTLYIYNYGSVSISTNTPYVWPDGSTTSSAIAAGQTVKLVADATLNQYVFFKITN